MINMDKITASVAIGEFRNKETKKYFTYSLTKDEWAIKNGFKHEVDVLDGIRYGTVKKTKIEIAVDEDEDGKAITEHWKIDRHLVYNWG